MKNKIISLIASLAIAGIANRADATAIMTLSDGVNPSITVSDNSLQDFNPSLGAVFVNTNIGVWTLLISSGTTKPYLGTANSPLMDISISALSSGAGNLQVTYSDDSFGPASGTLNATISGNAINTTASDVLSVYGDTNNVAGALTTLLATTGVNSLPVTGTGSGPLGLPAPYALTEVVDISAAGEGLVSVDASFNVLSLACAASTGQVGVPYNSSLVANGACTPYINYAIISGALPPGLTLNPATGAITGTPTTAGNYPYVAQVTDSCGNKADTSSQNCGITISCNGQIGDFVWNDVNGNGCQDAGEPGIAGVEVDLYSGCGVTGTPIASTLTDSTGHYLFSGLCPGTYTVSFNTPAGYTRTVANVGCVDSSLPPYVNQLDSKCGCAPGTPCGVCVTLTAANPINLNVDCGYVCNGQIGDYVWKDLNGNGCQDANEPGIQGVRVDLYSGCGFTNSLVASTLTDTNGHYLFSGLCMGTYTVSFTTPAGYTRTVANVGCVNSSLPPYKNQLDSKCSCASGTPCGVCVTLTAANPVNLNVDCGYIPTLAVICAANTGQANVPYNSSLVASGGCTPYTFSIISGALPPGLTLNPATGAITGTPTNTSTFSYVAQVKDNCGNTADTSSENCGITISCQPCVTPALGLGAASTTTVLELGAKQVSITGPAGGIIGNVYIAPGGNANWSGGGEYVQGNVYLGAGAKYQNSGTILYGSVYTNQNLSAQINAAYAAYNYYISLTATKSYSSGTTVATIADTVGAGKTNVVDFAGNLHPNGTVVGITGSANSLFIIRVHGQLKLDGGGQIRAISPVQPANIIYVIVGNQQVGATGGGGGSNCCKAVYDGTILAPYAEINLSPGLVNGEIISGQNISIVSGSGVHCPVCN